jgi:hypothetical protein
VFSGEATNTNFIVFGLQLPGLEPTIYRTALDKTIQWLKEKGKTMIYKTLHGKLKIVQLESHSKKGRDEYRCSERVSSSYSTSGTPYITLVTNSVMS